MNNSNTSELCHHPVHPLIALPLALVIFETVFGNLLVILAVARTQQLQTTTSIFITSLACADLIVGCVVQPVSSAMLLTGSWPLCKEACDFWTSVDVMCVTASTQTLCAIAVDRYVAITRPLRYKALLNKWRARFIACTVWMISALISFVPIMGNLARVDRFLEKDKKHCCDFFPNKSYAVISSITSFYMPLLVMLIIYGQVFVIATQQVKMIDKDRVRFSSSDIQTFKKEPSAVLPAEAELSQRRKSSRFIVHQHRALKTLGLIMGVFTLCWLPFFVAIIVVVFNNCPIEKEKNVMMWLNWLGYVNSGLNPIIYCHSSEYRIAFHNLLQILKPKCPGLVGVYNQFRLCCPCLSGNCPVKVICSNHEVFLKCNEAKNQLNPQQPLSEATGN